MTFQFLIVLILTALCILYFLKDLLRSALSGGCSSGCGGCKSGCPVKKLEALKSDRPDHRTGPGPSPRCS